MSIAVGTPWQSIGSIADGCRRTTEAPGRARPGAPAPAHPPPGRYRRHAGRRRHRRGRGHRGGQRQRRRHGLPGGPEHPEHAHRTHAARTRHAAGRHTRGESTAAVLGPATGVRGTTPVPVLMYHVIARRPPAPRSRACTCSPSQFAAQMQALKAGRLARGDPGPAPGLLDQGGQAPRRQADRHHLRQRLPLAVHRGAAGAAQDGLGRRREHPAQRPAAVTGRADQQRGQGDGERRLGARHPGHQPRRSHHPGRRAAALPDRHRPQDDPAPLRRARQLVLLPVGPLRHDRDQRRARRRLCRLHHGHPRLGRPLQRPLPPAAPARAGRHQPVGPAQRRSPTTAPRRRRRAPTGGPSASG